MNSEDDVLNYLVQTGAVTPDFPADLDPPSEAASSSEAAPPSEPDPPSVPDFLSEPDFNYSEEPERGNPIPGPSRIAESSCICPMSRKLDIASHVERKLGKIVVEEKLKDHTVKRVLRLFHEIGFESLPLTKATLVHTPRAKVITRSVPPGEYLHFGIQDFLLSFPDESYIASLSTISLDVHIDEAPLFGNRLWAIQGAFPKQNQFSPFLIGAYVGKENPESRDEFLSEFIDECNLLMEQGIICTKDGLRKPFQINLFCADSLARAFVTATQYPTGYHSCFKCDQIGFKIGRRTAFSLTVASPRTQETFRLRQDPLHHHSMVPSGLEKISNFDIVEQIIIDPMHIVDLGVVKKMIELFYKEGCVGFKLSSDGQISIDQFYCALAPFIPTNFARVPVGFDDLSDWKATQFRCFGAYTGLITYHAFMPNDFYRHFLLLFCSIRLLSNSKMSEADVQLAKSLLESFVLQFPDFYGRDRVSYNVHALLHLSDCAAKFGPLPGFAAFRFENFFREIKDNVSKTHQILAQLRNRNAEQSYIARSQYQSSSSAAFADPLPQHSQSYGSNFAYKTFAFSNFTITAGRRDGCCMLTGNIPVSVLAFGKQNDIDGFIGKRYLNPRPFFLSPINSLDVGVSIVDELNEETEFFPVSQIENKIIRIPYEGSFLLINLLHCETPKEPNSN
ncbi:uncharacterized protein LOC129786828 [Lutzomyia longipalpis]|uniref:uncharacterized protein LOC129786828 n=1 Tax=Lutzomyia longipalpis TaxID=7200 RepID=UPI0024845C2C|nr:uncharacterized protein LOC129786828 [Lutzomyia longipalpis]